MPRYRLLGSIGLLLPPMKVQASLEVCEQHIILAEFPVVLLFPCLVAHVSPRGLRLWETARSRSVTRGASRDSGQESKMLGK